MKLEEILAILVALILAMLAIVNNARLPAQPPVPPKPVTQVTVGEDNFIRVEATTLTEYSLTQPKAWVEPFTVFIKDPRVYSLIVDGRTRDGSYQTDASFNLVDSQGNLVANPVTHRIPIDLTKAGETYFDIYVKAILRNPGQPDTDNGGKGLLVPLVLKVKEQNVALGRVRTLVADCGDFAPVCTVARLREP